MEIVEITNETVAYYSRHTKEMKGSQVHKARLFLEYDSLHYLGFDDEYDTAYTFVCLPLNTAEEWTIKSLGRDVSIKKKAYPTDYNTSEYKIYKNKDGLFECNCQGWQTRNRRGEIHPDGCMCSHVLALFYAFKTGRFSKGKKKETQTTIGV